MNVMSYVMLCYVVRHHIIISSLILFVWYVFLWIAILSDIQTHSTITLNSLLYVLGLVVTIQLSSLLNNHFFYQVWGYWR